MTSVGYCGPAKKRDGDRFLKMKTRMTQARLFVMDEMSMIGRKMLGKIEFKMRDFLKTANAEAMDEILFGGKDVVLAGDPKQAAPIGDDPMYREGLKQLISQSLNFSICAGNSKNGHTSGPENAPEMFRPLFMQNISRERFCMEARAVF